MNKFFFLFFPLFLFAVFINTPFKFSLKKDQYAFFTLYYKGFQSNIKIRWTLYINDVLNVIYFRDKFPREVTLFNSFGLRQFKINITDFPDFNPVLYIKVNKFSPDLVEFELYLNKNYEKKVKIDYKGNK